LAVVDTLAVIDTLTVVDTVTVVDTLIYTDTVIVVVTDTTGSQMLCSRISSHQPEIVWMFRNEEENFKLEFDASPESDHPSQKLLLNIDGREVHWSPVLEPELITEQFLNENATIRIIATKPPALGHAIDICVTLSKP
jgi:hypothetical protein